MVQSVYDSAWHHPGVAWLATAALVVWLLVERRKVSTFVRGYLFLFAAEIALDAFFTGQLAPKSISTVEWKNLTAAITFVIAGDYRFYVLVERFAPASAPKPTSLGPVAAWLRALPWAFLVPLSWTLVYEAKLIEMPDLYFKFLVYELMFVVVALVLRFGVLPRRLAKTSAPERRYVLGLATYEVVQYGLWALADIIMRAGYTEPGYALRIVPNVMYYGGFLFFAWNIAPATVRSADRVSSDT